MRSTPKPENLIPEESRRIVETRERGLCAVCRGPGSEWHHRRGRAVRGPHRHCPCNGLLLCYKCHPDAHSKATWAYREGLIVAREVAEPMSVPQRRIGMWWIATCDGLLQPLDDFQVRIGILGRPEVLRA